MSRANEPLRRYRRIEKRFVVAVIRKYRVLEIGWAGVTTLQRYGLEGFLVRLSRWLRGERRFLNKSDYADLIAQLEPSPADLQKQRAATGPAKPLLNIVMVAGK